MNFFEPNSTEIKPELVKNKEYFDAMFKGIDDNILLDEQQRIAVLLNASNLLVVAGAGSGKTTTMVAKVKYLIDKCNYQESEIVVLSFTKKVKEELKRLINDEFGYKNVKVSTFHALGLHIIKTSGENYNGIVDDAGQYKILAKYIKTILFKDKEKFNNFLDAFSNKLFFSDCWDKYSNFEDFHEASYKNFMNKNNINLDEYNDLQIKKRREYKKSINGEYLRSKEEVDIANYLFINGIDYEYEKKYDKDSNTKWYHPDFYIRQLEKENYIEHFGIDEDGHNDMYTDEQLTSYLKNLKVKQSFFNENFNKNLFIITYSKYNDKSKYIDNLNEQLVARGYILKKLSEEEIYNRLRDTSQDSYYSRFIDKLLIPFISLF
ncbi:MAG TPA: UvrD-helicase domain-containing protein, partial [Gallicola sp.]|nr:UvrD-helicase domain-containing protein [Gallicola sp.]